jgi:hypothetical protein
MRFSADLILASDTENAVFEKRRRIKKNFETVTIGRSGTSPNSAFAMTYIILGNDFYSILGNSLDIYYNSLRREL